MFVLGFDCCCLAVAEFCLFVMLLGLLVIDLLVGLFVDLLVCRVALGEICGL